MKLYFALIILLFSLAQYEFASKTHRVYFTGHRCEDINKRIMKHAECFMVPNDNGQLMMNMRLMFSEDIKKDFMWRFSLNVKMWSSNFTYVNMAMDYCESLNAAQKHLLLRYVFEEIFSKSNLPVECPIKANVMYELLNFTLSTKIVPIAAPTLTWHVSLRFALRNVTLLHLHLLGSVDRLK